MRLIDTHAHLQLEDYDKDREEVLSRSRALGIERMVIVGTDPATNEQALEFSHSRPGLFPTVGWHPHDAKDWTPGAWERLARQAENPRVVAIGEVGLDYFKNFSPVEQQKTVFREAIRLARRLGKPLIVHSRDAHRDVIALLGEEGGGNAQGVMHCFSADWDTAKTSLEIGFYISFSAVITYPKNDALREVAGKVPADRLLAETDCPFLPPHGKRGQRNEPSAVSEVVQCLARARNNSEEETAEQIWGNAERLFRLL